MDIRTVRRVVVAFFTLYLLAIVWPVVSLVGDARPLVLGLPLPFAWAIGWIVLGALALALLEWAESRHETGSSGAED
jgi:hypothetical protein